MPELIKLLPEGSAVVAVIVIVVLFLKQQREQEKRLEGIVTGFNDRIKEATTAYQTQIDRITKQVMDDKMNTQLQMQKLFDGFMSISKETVATLTELKSAVTGLKDRVNELGIANQSQRKMIPDKSREERDG